MQRFFTERMIKQRQASPATIRSYRTTFRLLLTFAQDRTGKAPATLDWADLDAAVISKPTGTTVHAAATPDSPHCGRCSATPLFATPSTPRSSPRSWRFPRNVTTRPTYHSSNPTRSRPCSPLPTRTGGRADATVPC
jgi:hypothetical protein